MADSLIEALRRTRPGYEAERTWQRFLLDAYAGTGGFRGAVRQPLSSYWGPASEAYGNTDLDTCTESEESSYLDRYPREDLPKFRRRMRAAHYSNYVEPIVDLRISYMLRKDFNLEDVPEQLDAFKNDIDGRGTPLWKWVHTKLARRAALVGWIPVVVDAPVVDVVGELNQAQARALGIRPRAIALWPANLLEYHHNGDEFVWVKLRTDHIEHPNPLVAPVHYERYTMWTRDSWRVIEVGERDSVRADTEWRPHRFGRVPLEVLRHQQIDDEPVRGLSMIGDLATAARALFNRESELEEHLRSQVFAILQIITDEPEKISELSIGVDNALALHPDAKNAHSYIAPPPSVADTYETRIERSEKSIYRMGRVEYTRPTGAAASGASRRYEFDHTNRAIADYASSIADFLERLFRTAGAVSGVDAKSTRCTAPQDFDVQALDQDIEAALKARGLGLGPTADKALRSRVIDRVLPGLPSDVRKKIEAELEQQAELDRNLMVMGYEDEPDDEPDDDVEDPDDEPTEGPARRNANAA